MSARQRAEAGALLAGVYLLVTAWRRLQCADEGWWQREHPVLAAGVALPPPCWGFAFGAGCFVLCPLQSERARVESSLGDPSSDTFCCLEDKARAAPVSFFSLLHPAWLVFPVPGGLSPAEFESLFHAVPQLGHLRALPLGCKQGTQMLAGWWHCRLSSQHPHPEASGS